MRQFRSILVLNQSYKDLKSAKTYSLYLTNLRSRTDGFVSGRLKSATFLLASFLKAKQVDFSFHKYVSPTDLMINIILLWNSLRCQGSKDSISVTGFVPHCLSKFSN